jgi:phage tail-like protein
VPNDLISTDPLVSNSFFLEIDGSVVTTLSGVSGLDVEVDVVELVQNGDKGQRQIVKTVGGQNKAPDISLTRMAPVDASKDAMWKWFNDVRDKGMPNANRGSTRKNGSIVLYDTTNKEVSRFNFFNAWPSKISTDGLSTDGNDAVKETITLVCERLERVK